MDPFRVEYPASVAEAVDLLGRSQGRAKLCAGGTDLIPNLKHRLYEPEVVIHLGKIHALRGVIDAGDHLKIGALTTLDEIANHAAVREHAPSLARAAAEVAGPQLRKMGTIGGNLCLETRCLYYNQTYFWREALGFCLKKDGTVCHVVAGGQKCVAASSNDTATVLLALDAFIDVSSPAGDRTLSVDDLYVADGIKNTVLGDADLLSAVRVPKARDGVARREGFAKLRHRQAIDFPLLSVAIRIDLACEVIDRAKLVVNALQAKPHVVKIDFARGRSPDEALAVEIAEHAYKRCNPTTSIADDPAWRKEMVPVYVRRAWDEAWLVPLPLDT
jgi:4-hydroxybenzoyl-CoA reductase subunit beta